MSNNIRIEEDLLGTREVPADAYYGVHTLRAIENFYISNNKISDIPEFVRGMVMVKKAAAMANKELQTIPKSVANAIIAACDEVLNNGKCMDQFPVDVYQGGAGTSVNMNTNEVLANIGLEHLCPEHLCPERSPARTALLLFPADLNPMIQPLFAPALCSRHPMPFPQNCCT